MDQVSRTDDVQPRRMAVDFALFREDVRLVRGRIAIGNERQRQSFSADGGELELTVEHVFEFPACPLQMQLRSAQSGEVLWEAGICMGVHQSDDWESLELLEHTLAFRCEPSV